MTDSQMQQGERIATLDALRCGECLEFCCARGDAFLVRHADGWQAFRNHCPHIGLQLNWKPNEFFDSSGKLLICSGHGALFQPQDGRCISGPCNGQALEAIAIEVREDGVYLAEP